MYRLYFERADSTFWARKEHRSLIVGERTSNEPSRRKQLFFTHSIVYNKQKILCRKAASLVRIGKCFNLKNKTKKKKAWWPGGGKTTVSFKTNWSLKAHSLIIDFRFAIQCTSLPISYCNTTYTVPFLEVIDLCRERCRCEQKHTTDMTHQ